MAPTKALMKSKTEVKKSFQTCINIKNIPVSTNKNIKKELEMKNPQVSVEQSVEFMQKLTVVAVSTIAYLRDIFPPSAFSEQRLNGLRVNILRGDESIPGTKTLIDWLKGAFMAVQKHFLKKMILVIQEQKNGSTLEMYSFGFIYNQESTKFQLLKGREEDVIIMEKEINNKQVPEAISKAVQQMLRSVLTLTTTMQPLPNECELSMILEFYDEIPDDFTLPSGFKAVDSLGLNFPQETVLKLGRVDTKFSSISLSTKSVLNQVEDDDNENQIVDELVELSQDPYQHTLSLVSPSVKNIPIENQQGGSGDHTNLSEALSTVLSLYEKVLRCICECNESCLDDLKCASCLKFQHRACYKVLPNQQVKKHICVNCHDPLNPDKICRNTELIYDDKRKENALYRQALVMCLSNVRVSSNSFVNQLGVSRQVGKELLNRLDSDGCLRPACGKGNIRSIKAEYLKEHVINLYFSSDGEDDTLPMEIDENNSNAANLNKRKICSNTQMEPSDKTFYAQPKRLKYGATESNLILK